MFIEQAFTKDNNFGKYLLGSLIAILASFVGQLPITIALMIKIFTDGKDMSSLNSNSMYTLLDLNWMLFLMLLTFATVLPVLFVVIKKLHNQTVLVVTTTRKSIDWSRVFFTFGLWTVVTVVSVYVDYQMNPRDYVWNFQLIPFAILFVIAIVMIPIQTSVEEYVFRGYLMQGFGVLAKNKFVPLLMTSIIFGALHLLNPEVDKLGYVMMVYYIGTGLLLGIMTLMDEGMELALGFHAANNLVGCLLVTTSWSALQTHSILKDISEPNAGFDVVLPVIIIYPIILLILSKKYGWKNWQEKLTGNIVIK